MSGSDGLGCSELREQHGDYLDGLLTVRAAALIQTHLDGCADCARYDRIVRRGLALARDLPDVEPAHDFAQRLQHRIFHVQDATPLAAERPLTGIGMVAAVAGVIALIAWSPVLLEKVDAAARYGAEDAPPLVVPLALAGPHNVAGSAWYDGSVRDALSYAAGARPTVFPGPYSPLIVNPPAHGVRMISTEYRASE